MAELYLAGLEDVWRSERLIFRAIQQEDYDFLYNNIDADPITQSLATPSILRPPRKEKPEDWFKNWKEHGFLLDVIICLRPDVGSNEKHLEPPTVSGTPSPEPIPIGMLSLLPRVYGREAKNRASSFGITIAPPFQNSGYGTEAVNWALEWAFRRANLHSVHLGSVEYNTRAHKCYQKCGFKLDGRNRQCHWHDRKWYDLYLFSILEDEWEEMRRERNSEL